MRLRSFVSLSLQTPVVHLQAAVLISCCRHLFWVAVSVLQLDEVQLYAAGLALLEQNLHTLDILGLFNEQVRAASSTRSTSSASSTSRFFLRLLAFICA